MANTKVTSSVIADGTITAAKIASGALDSIIGGYLTTNTYATEGYVTTAVNNLIDAAPASLDTLNELAAALNDDANFATTVTNSLATKLNLSGGNIAGDFSVDTDTLYIDTVNNRVGIGTNSPNALGSSITVLEIRGGSGNLTRSGGVYLTNNDNTLQAAEYFVSSVFRNGTITNHPFALVTNNAERLRIDSSGNVIVGSTTANNVNAATLRQDGTAHVNNVQLANAAGSVGGTTPSIYSPAGGQLAISLNSAERMRIDGNGNVGIGTSSPVYKLTLPNDNFISFNNDPTNPFGIGGGDNAMTRIVMGAASGAGSTIQFGVGSNGTYSGFSSKMTITSGGNVGIGLTDPRGDLSFANQVSNGVFAPTSYTASSSSAGQNFINNYYTSASYGTYNYPRYMDIVAVGQPDGTSGGSHIRFFTNPRTANAPSEVRMDIAYDGTVLFNKGYLYVGSSNQVIQGGSDASNLLRIWQRSANPIDFLTYDQTRMRIDANGNIGAPTGTNIYNASDQRVKRNIRPISYGLNTVLGLNPVKFNWIQGFNEYEENKELLGFIAQEIQQVLPEAVEQFAQGNVEINGETIENTLRVNEKFIIPVLVKAIQELKTEIETLKSQINA